MTRCCGCSDCGNIINLPSACVSHASAPPAAGLDGNTGTVWCNMTTETDPHGKDRHAPGAKADLGKPRVGLMAAGFAQALTSVAQVTTFGAQKYSPGGWRTVPDGVERYTDALYRHLLAHASGEETDTDSGLPHMAHAAWNALAVLELMNDENRRTVLDDAVHIARLHGGTLYR